MTVVATDSKSSQLGPAGHPQAWYRRRGVLWAAGIAVFVGAAVLSDLPQHTSRSGQISSGASVIKQINSDIGPCAYAVKEAVMIESDLENGSLSAANRARVPGLLRDDQNACAFTDSSINDLANLEVPGSAAGNYLGNAVTSATMWASSDALGTVETVQTLASRPADAAARTQLARYERLMASDRAAVMADVASAERVLGTRLPAVELPDLSVSG